ncbi:hypothetical protein Tco_0154475 [Tanacetum coccineum]
MIVWIWMIISDTTLLAYVNGDHEYALFNPYGTDMHKWKISPTDHVSGLEGIWPRNGFHQAMRPKKITMVLEMKESAKNDLELNGTDIVPLYFGTFYVMKSVCVEGFPSEGTQIENIMNQVSRGFRSEFRFSEATSGGNAAADPFDASVRGANDDDLYN